MIIIWCHFAWHSKTEPSNCTIYPQVSAVSLLPLTQCNFFGFSLQKYFNGQVNCGWKRLSLSAGRIKPPPFRNLLYYSNISVECRRSFFTLVHEVFQINFKCRHMCFVPTWSNWVCAVVIHTKLILTKKKIFNIFKVQKRYKSLIFEYYSSYIHRAGYWKMKIYFSVFRTVFNAVVQYTESSQPVLRSLHNMFK